ncbi:alpha/beta fold hydrolase [Nocardioides insulae]|uniref:alpha/beta fold hydrolase n=1 Tax=Nocardioides insulae TaxID=394734 RepID=UPI0004004B65|nr:alpha/beta hydrolase [Nocardioides insulae]
MASPDTRMIDLDQVRIAYAVSGSTSPPLVLVHGSWGSHHNWDPVVTALSRHLRVLTYDRRGHSESSAPPGQGSFTEDVADLAALIERLGVGPAWVAGNSSGAVIALQLAAARPDLLRGLVAHEPPLVGLLAPGTAEAEAWAARDRGPVAEVGRRIAAGDHAGAAEQFVDEVALGPGSWARLPESLRAMMTGNAPTYLDELRDSSWRSLDEQALTGYGGPVLLTGGGQSPAFFAAVLDRLEEFLPHAERHLHPQAGHIPHVTHPEEYVDTLVRFVGAHEQAGAAR